MNALPYTQSDLPDSPEHEVRILAMETSGRSGSVALLKSYRGVQQYDQELLDERFGSAKTLAPAIHKLLQRNAVEPKDLSAIALISGPGSFTGLRVGVATAKAMAYALKLTVLEVDALDAIALQNTPTAGVLHVVMDAYRGQVFYASYTSSERNVFEKRSPTRIIDIEHLFDDAYQSEKDTDSIARWNLLGPGCGKIRKMLEDEESFGGRDMTAIVESIVWMDERESLPTAISVATLGYRNFLEGRTVDAVRLMPHYYRESAAEELAMKPKQPES